MQITQNTPIIIQANKVVMFCRFGNDYTVYHNGCAFHEYTRKVPEPATIQTINMFALLFMST